MIKLIRKVISYMFSLLFTSILGICHLVILVVLGLFGIVTAVFTVLMPVFGLLRAFGAENIFIIWNDMQVPSILGLSTGIFLGIICASLSWFIFRAFMKYFNWISKNGHDSQ